MAYRAFLAVLLSSISVSAFAEDAEFHASTYTTYKQHDPYAGEVRLLDRLPPVGKYIEIGIVRVGTDKVEGIDDAVADLKAITAKHGGNAIVLEDDAKIFANGGMTGRGTRPANATAMAIIAQ